MKLALHVDFDPSMPTGIGRYGIELTRSIAVAGERPSVWIESGSLPAWRGLGLETGGVRVLRKPHRVSSRIGPSVFSLMDGIDIVHSFGTTLPHFVLPGSKRSTAIHDMGPFLYPEMKAPEDTASWRSRISDAVSGADCLLVNSKTTRADLLEIFPDAESRVFLTLPGVDHFTVQPRPGRKPDRDGHILVVGIIEPRKNLERVFEAWAILSGRPGGGDLPPIVVAGHDGYRAGEIHSAPSRLGIEGSVRFEGYTSESHLQELYSGASMLVHAALYDGFGFTVPEAFAHGLPVAASDRASIREVFSGACNLFDPLDPHSIAEAVSTCLETGVTPEQLAERRRIVSTHTWARCAAQTLAAFGAVLES